MGKGESMSEKELLEALETVALRNGLESVLSLLLDRVTQGYYLDIFQELCDMAADAPHYVNQNGDKMVSNIQLERGVL
jgi:hypothetical protein